MNRQGADLDTYCGSAAMRRLVRDVEPRNADELHGYCMVVLGLDIPRAPRLAGHAAPFDYLCHAFFEEAGSGGGPRDCVVWACRGGGKTLMGAVATVLDMMFKPGIQIRILGGSLEQSSKMHAYIRQLLEREHLIELVEGRLTGRHVQLRNGSRVEILAQSEQSVRGVRVQKLRCDEVELFSPEIWQAAQLVTRSAPCGEHHYVHGCVEALSTMHRPFGLMNELLTGAHGERRVFCWSMLDVLEHCREDQRSCEGCGLWENCQGRARKGRGHITIDDALAQRRRTTALTWQAEMLCEKPMRSDCVYPEFDERVHVAAWKERATDGMSGAGNGEGKEEDDGEESYWVAGMDFGFRAPTVYLLARFDAKRDVLHVVGEHVANELTVDEHVARITKAFGKRRPRWVGIDPAGYQRHEHLGTSTAQLLMQKAEWKLRSRRLELRAGIEAVRLRLKSADQHVGLMVDPKCEHLIRCLRTYHFPADDQESAQPVKDGTDHACDALRYLIINLDRSGEKMRYRMYAGRGRDRR